MTNKLVNIFFHASSFMPQNAFMDVGQRLEYFRNREHHTQESLAAESKVTRTTIANIENGRSSPTVATLKVLLAACKTTLGEFFAEYEQKEISQEHQELHRRLQEILESDDVAAPGITVNINYLHGHMLTLMQEHSEEFRRKEKKAARRPKEPGRKVG